MTLSVVVFITLGFSHTVYATELNNPENVDKLDNFDNAYNIDNIDNYDDSDNVEEDSDIEHSLSEDVIVDEEETSDDEETYDPELYEIYEDEQGQIYYIEKKPVKLEIEKPDDVIQDDVKVKKATYTKKELRLLSCLVYTEAGNQSDEGMLAVANVVLNRVKSSVYGHVNTIKEVIYDKMWNVQFSVTKKNKKTGKSMLDNALLAYDTGVYTGKNPAAEKRAMDRAIEAAKAALNGENVIGDYLCFRVNNKDAKNIKSKYKDYKILGDHIFYRTK